MTLRPFTRRAPGEQQATTQGRKHARHPVCHPTSHSPDR
jgi:hypothetical protein